MSACVWRRSSCSVFNWLRARTAMADAPPAKRMKEEEQVGDVEAVKTDEEAPEMLRRRKCLLLLSYSGKGYMGMQRNAGLPTIEEELLKALSEVGAIKKDFNLGQLGFQRCSRTDKGVSAARQVVSLKMPPMCRLVGEMNEILPDQIRIMALKRVTKSFNCKLQCTSRVYEYLLPTYAFAQFEDTRMDYRISATVITKIQELLKMYEGTHNFHNFTSGKKFEDPSAKRYIMSFVAGDPFLVQDVEFITLTVEGQGFMVHQIRKMIGLVIAIVRGWAATDMIPYAYNEDKVDIPRAPGLGLMLDNVRFRNYNRRFGDDGVHELLDWTEYEDAISKFKEQYIYKTIFDTELRQRSMMKWLETLQLHDFHQTSERLKAAAMNSNEEEEEEKEEKEKDKERQQEEGKEEVKMVNNEEKHIDEQLSPRDTSDISRPPRDTSDISGPPRDTSDVSVGDISQKKGLAIVGVARASPLEHNLEHVPDSGSSTP